MKTLKVGSDCLIRINKESFTGIVQELRKGWVRVSGKGSISNTTFDEWFSTEAKVVSIQVI